MGAVDETEATAVVTVVLQVRTNSTWGPTTHLSQVYDQAATEAEGMLRRAFGALPEKDRRYSIVSCEVQSVMAKRKKV